LYWAAEVSGGQAHRGHSRVIVPVVHWHLACFANEGDEEPIFTSPKASRCITATSGAAYGCPLSAIPS
jgi:hypothetical protein